MEDAVINYSFILLTVFFSFSITLVLVKPLIEYLKSKLIGQYIREDGPQEHHSKKGTPTMGGIAMLAATVISGGFILTLTRSFSTEAMLCLTVIAGFGLLGFADDYLKVVKKQNKGVSGWTKLTVQIILATLVTLYVFLYLTESSISVFGLEKINLGYLYILLGIFVVVGSSNAINLTDGLDGLASLTSAVSFFTLSFFLYKTGHVSLALIAASIGGSCLGFLVFNYHPAKIFMGDVGSLMLGGAFGALGVLGRLELWLIPIGIIFVVECLSVIIQVISFQSTGKRVFKMTPLHHHFELCGNKETAVVKKFFMVQVIFCLISIILGYLWLF